MIPLNGTDNLVPQNKRTKEEQRAIARKGGIASGESRRRRKTLREELLLLLEDNQMQQKISVALLKEAQKGNTKAFEIVRDTIGEKPKETIDINDVTNKKFDEICGQIGGGGLDE